MTTYSFIKYDVLKDIMYFKSTPTPSFKQLIKTEGISTEQDREVIGGIQSSYNNLIPQDAFEYIKSYLEAIPELDLSGSKNITLKIEIDEDTNEVGTVLIISQNTNRTLTTINVPTNDWPTPIASKIKFPVKWPTLAKCGNCLKFTFQKDNVFNFVGNLGGQWDGSFKNGQKVYQFYLPDYSDPNTYGNTTDYRIFWKPNITGTFSLYDGGTLTINNENKWIAVPSSSIGTVNELSNTTFFHALSNTSASCPFTPNPNNPTWNFQGDQGFFLLELSQTGVTSLGVTKCPQFIPTPGDVDWGYNCGPNGCVEAPSGSVGTYATLEDCKVSCSIDPTQSVEYICTSNGCVQVPSGSGGYTTLAQCEGVCNYFPIEECNCTDSSQTPLVPLLNPDFNLGSIYWNITPTQNTPGVGGWNFSSFNALANVSNGGFNNVNTSSVSISQPNVLSLNCTYEICFKAWNGVPNITSLISIDTGNYTTNLPPFTPNLTTIPTTYTLIISNIQTTDLIFYVAGNGRVYINDICVKQTYCPPPTSPTSSLILTGSTYCYTDVEYDCTCPEGYISDGSGSCIGNESLITNAGAGLYTPSNVSSSYIGQPYGNGNIIMGYSINQPGSITSYINPNIVNDAIPAFVGMAQPILYYNWNLNGSGNSSTNNPSPFLGSSLVYNTQYTFDILSSSFWYQPELGDNWASRWVTQLCRNTNNGANPGGATSYKWVGFGTTLDVPSNKTYYVGIIGQGAMKVKLDGTTILCTSPSETIAPPYTSADSTLIGNINYPAYAQNCLSRYPSFPNGTYNWGIMPAPYFSLNNNIITPISSSYFNWDLTPGPEYANFSPIVYNNNGGNSLSGYNLYIYPITMSAGCHQINFENVPQYFAKFCGYTEGFMGAIILDNTAEQLISASSYSDLNIVWDSTYLPLITSSYVGMVNPGTGLVPLIENYYLYTYPVDTIPPSSSYSSWCPTNSTPVGGNPCDGCFTTESITTSIPCGDCVECTHGLLYNGYVVDAGGPTYTGRGAAGIVNINPIDNPINTWKIPENNDWYDLVTFINDSTPPSNVTPTGSYGVDVGGKLKDYTRDLIATCWGFPNVGAQTDDFSSGWNGVAGGIRNNVGAFSELKLEGYWWTANSTLSSAPLKLAAVNLKHYSNEIYREDLFKSYGCSIRLVRPAEPGETSGDTILNAYVGNDGTTYDGIVLGTQVWITVNLSETKYNDGSNITLQPNANVWDDTLTTANKFACYYNNLPLNANLPTGNVNPITGLCYEYPIRYVYKKCGSTDLLIQTEPGATTTPGEIQKADDYSCWEFVEETQSNSGITYQLYIEGNYFENNTTVYTDCEECTAIHTIYMTFETKNC